MSHIRLGVNVDHVATIRQNRKTLYPDPVLAASICELAGADQITVHLRLDRRHIQERDLYILRQTVQTEINLELAAEEDVLAIACDLKPETATLVPERHDELTTEGGLSVVGREAELGAVINRLKKAGIRVSLFINPDPASITAAVKAGADQIEIHTGFYSHVRGQEQAKQLARIAEAAETANKHGIAIAAGHGLGYFNTQAICAIPGINELNIGHAIISRAIMVGMKQAVKDMIAVIAQGLANRKLS
jgi:pyridoxine 5-phosphate synthase